MYKRKEFSKETKEKAFAAAPEIAGKNPNLYRRTADGGVAHWSADRTKQFGFEFDHKNPTSKGGTASIKNCNLLTTEANRKKSTKPNIY